jgi:hypothetical protein
LTSMITVIIIDASTRTGSGRGALPGHPIHLHTSGTT